MPAGRKPLYLVLRDGAVEGAFVEKPLAEKFSTYYPDAGIEESVLFTEVPKMYKFRCSLDLDTGVPTVSPVPPSLDYPIFEVYSTSLLAVGETEEEATKAAQEFYAKIKT